jgi:hypothetical protein
MQTMATMRIISSVEEPCTFSVRVATEAVKGTREPLYSNLPRGFTVLFAAPEREKICGSNVLSFLACRAG